MDKEKKLYCRLASEFTIEELEAKIGPFTGEYQLGVFRTLAAQIEKMTPEVFIDNARAYLFWNKDRSGLLYEILDDGEYGLDYDYPVLEWMNVGDFIGILICCNDDGTVHDDEGILDEREVCLIKEARSLEKKIEAAICDLGFIRDFKRIQDDRLLYMKRMWNIHLYPESFLNIRAIKDYVPNVYEAWNNDYSEQERLEALVNFISEKLPPLQRDIFKYDIMSGNMLFSSKLIREGDLVTKINSGYRKFYYSEIEYKLLCAARENVWVWWKEIVKFFANF